MLQLIDMAADLHLDVEVMDAQLHALATHAFGQQGQGAFHCLCRIERLLLDFRTPAKHPHVIDHPRRALDLGVDTAELVLQVVGRYIAVAQALEHIGDGHAHDVQRLVDFMGQARGHFPEGGHLGALHQLLLGAPHFSVVAAHRLDFQQLPLVIENAAVRPHPPGVFAPGQLQADFGGADRELRGQLLDAQQEGCALLG